MVSAPCTVAGDGDCLYIFFTYFEKQIAKGDDKTGTIAKTSRLIKWFIMRICNEPEPP